MKNLYCDIETIPAQPEMEMKAEIAKTIEAPATMTKPETIAAWHNSEGKYEGVKDALIEEQYRKTSLNAMQGSICCLAWAIDDGDVLSAAAIDDVSEKDMLRYFYDSVMTKTDGKVFFVNHSVRFDLKYIWQRSMIGGLKPSFNLPFNGRHEQHFYCTMEAWGGFKNYVSMDAIAKAMQISGKPEGMDGSKVWDEWKAGNHSKVIEYNKEDVKIARELHLRFTGVK
jgi:predicted PolB exonuclease-like 3'-5' exonuclease